MPRPARPRCFGDFGAEAARFLYVLAFLESQQNDDMRDKAWLPPLPRTDRSQFRARCLSQSSTRISAALAKATVMRITVTPSLPTPRYLSHVHLARNCPGPADALLHRTPLCCRLRQSTGCILLHHLPPSPLPSLCCVRSLPFSVDLERAP